MNSRPGQAVGRLLGLDATASSAKGVYLRWDEGGLWLGASIFGVVFFGLIAYLTGHYAVTGRHHLAKAL